MNNIRNPKCRDAFIAELTRQTGQVHGLGWHTTGDKPKDWEWNELSAEEGYRGWCLLYGEPSDVDPESILGKLHGIRDLLTKLRAESKAFLLEEIVDIIELIESLQQKAEVTP